MKKKGRKRFSKEFKLEAVRLIGEGKKPAVELAWELGIRRNQPYKWKEKIDKHGGSAFPERGRCCVRGSEAEEIIRLRRDLEKIKEENEILKKAAAFFARELK